jgi:hypothetical protein
MPAFFIDPCPTNKPEVCKRILLDSMKPSRNFILILGLALFFLWYLSSWAYRTLYAEPRQRLGNEIAKLTNEIETGRRNYTMMSQFFEQAKGFYARSLPKIPNDARSLYSFWLLELLQYSGFEDVHVDGGQPSRLPFGADYRYNIRCTGSLPQFSRFLFEFYYAPFLHRVNTMTLTPLENDAERLTFSLMVDALALQPRLANDPYPMVNQLPTGWYVPRLTSNSLTSYQVIADRNLLQTAKGGVDPADHAFLTAINQVGGQTEVWFSVRTNDSIIKAELRSSLHVGSFSGTVVEILDQDIVLDRSGTRWLLSLGECLNQAFALPPETVRDKP